MQNLHVSCVSSQLVSDSGAHGPLGTCPYVRGTAQTCAQAHPKDIGAPRRRCGMGSSQRPGQGIVDDVKRTLGTHWRAGMS